MLGLSGFWVNLGIILTLLSSLACVVYGVLNWNKSDVYEDEEIAEERKWSKTEKKILDEL